MHIKTGKASIQRILDFFTDFFFFLQQITVICNWLLPNTGVAYAVTELQEPVSFGLHKWNRSSRLQLFQLVPIEQHSDLQSVSVQLAGMH